MEDLAAVLQRLIDRPERFKLAKYDGKTDVELYLAEFEQIAAANRWEGPAALLHLKTSLTDDATACKRPADLDGVQRALRATFGLTRNQARDQLETTRHKPTQPLYSFGAEVERLVGIAYPEMAPGAQMDFAVDRFKRALGNRSLQQHLLAVPTDTMEATVRAAEEYLHIGRSRMHDVNSVGETSQRSTVLKTVMALQEKQAEQMSQLAELFKTVMSRTDDSQPRQPFRNHRHDRIIPEDRECNRCHEMGHFAGDCEAPAPVPGPQPTTSLSETRQALRIAVDMDPAPETPASESTRSLTTVPLRERNEENYVGCQDTADMVAYEESSPPSMQLDPVLRPQPTTSPRESSQALRVAVDMDPAPETHASESTRSSTTVPLRQRNEEHNVGCQDTAVMVAYEESSPPSMQLDLAGYSAPGPRLQPTTSPSQSSQVLRVAVDMDPAPETPASESTRSSTTVPLRRRNEEHNVGCQDTADTVAYEESSPPSMQLDVVLRPQPTTSPSESSQALRVAVDMDPAPRTPASESTRSSTTVPLRQRTEKHYVGCRDTADMVAYEESSPPSMQLEPAWYSGPTRYRGTRIYKPTRPAAEWNRCTLPRTELGDEEMVRRHMTRLVQLRHYWERRHGPWEWRAISLRQWDRILMDGLAPDDLPLHDGHDGYTTHGTTEETGDAEPYHLPYSSCEPNRHARRSPWYLQRTLLV